MEAQVTGLPRRGLAPITTRTFGRFRLERRLAYGGMAEILLATDLGTHRPVVLKRILPQYSTNPEFVQYFIHEGQLGQQLIHTNLVETYEAGQVADTCYIALEYLRGATCIELLRAAARADVELPLGAAVRIVADAARGLHYAHLACDPGGASLKVVHRDVTPHNLFVCRDGRIKVLDFGIAKAASQLHHTRTGTIKGKFSYLAPEQIRGETIDHRVDVFALGIVLHELLTLKPLFRGTNDADTLQRILTLEVPPPERVRHSVPPGLGAVALRALMRDRERRLPSAEALADSIEAVAEAECIDASREVVATLLHELCPPPPEESAPDDSSRLDFELDPPSVRSGSLRRAHEILAAPALALGATGSDLQKPREALPVLAQEEMESVPVVIATPLALSDTVPNRPSAMEIEPEVVSQPAVAIGRLSGAAPSMMEPAPRTRLAPLAGLVVAALVMVGAILIWRSLAAPPVLPPQAKVTEAPPPQPIEAPRAEPLPVEPPALVEPVPQRVEEGRLRVQTDGPANFLIDGSRARAAADGTIHLPPGRHKLVVTSALLATPRSFDVEVKSGETVSRTARSGRGRLRLAVTPWAEVQLDGRAVGTTPLAPLELSEGVHWLTLKNGDLGANLKRRVVIYPDKELPLRVDLFH